MLAACLFAWCLSNHIESPHWFTVTSDIRDNGRTERLVVYESRWLVLGGVEQTTARNAVFAGSMPLKINIFGDRLTLAGGVMAASAEVPTGGTHANFIARLHVRITDRVSIASWHVSNGHLGKINPSIDSIGLTVRLKQ